MALPIVSIVGRPNVGNSSLFNCLVGRKIAIVDPTPGVTRDRISSPLAVGEGFVELFDTGGLGIVDRDHLEADVTRQIDLAIADSALVLFVTDAREGATPLDREMARRLRRQDKPVLLVANKVDAPTTAAAAALGELERLGFGTPLPVSAHQRTGRQELLDAIAARVGPAAQPAPEPAMKLAVIGKRNAGKSSFVNALAGSERVIVSEIPGTTRDSIDVRVEIDGQSLIVIDTAGVRKRSRLADDIEFYSRHRALRSIRRADVVLLIVDAMEPVAQVDKQLVDYVVELHKPVVIVVNKWDLARDKARQKDYRPYLGSELAELAFAPIAFTVASEGRGVRQVIDQARALFEQARRRVPTAELNQAVEQVLARHSPRSGPTGKGPKLYYATQTDVAPPTIVCFVNDPKAFDATYRRYLLNHLRPLTPFTQVPIRLLFRARRRDDREE